jgi:putative Ca2+/H+ antiporter (TMEM165/GDT1 family)
MLTGEAVNSTAFFTAFFLVFLAEIGDKTQLTAMVLATRYPWKRIFAGIAAAFALLNLGAVLIGKLLYSLLPFFWIQLVSGILFLFFGVTTLMARADDDGRSEGEGRPHGPTFTAFSMIFFAELGDKTQLATTSLAARYDSPLSVFLGSTLALWSVSLVGIFLSKQISRYIPLFYMHKAAGGLFLIFGAVILYRAF